MRARVAALITALTGVTFAFAAPRLALNPGPHSQGHVRSENRCLDCHTPGRGTPNAKCIVCHALDRIVAGGAANDARSLSIRGLHRELTGARCTDCHTDHAGRDPHRATRAFTHDALAASRRQDCASCHSLARPADALHREAGGACASCHATSAWKPATFAHERWFVLDRDHAVACRTCHAQPGNFKRYTCYGCHEHTPARMRDEHREERVTDRELDDCVRCHRSADEREGRERGRERARRGGDDD